MAKKDSDEAFEDYDLDEEKPKKSKGGKKKRKSKTLLWVAAFIVILAILLLIRFKYAAPSAEEDNTSTQEDEAPEEEVENQYVTAPETTSEQYEKEAPVKDLGDQIVYKEDLPQVQSNIDTSEKPELFSNLKCEYDETSKLLYISLHVYNTLGEDIKISPRGVAKGYNTYFKIRGTVDDNPGCGTEILAPGEYTDCKRVGFDNARYSNTPGINRISVQVPGKTEALLIECPQVPEDAPVLQWVRAQ
jgi:hypothetical protein